MPQFFRLTTTVAFYTLPLCHWTIGLVMPTLNAMSHALVNPESLDLLAYEVALAYYPPNDLATYYRLAPATLEAICEMPEFQRRVMEHRRKIDEDGAKTKLAARKMVAESLPEIAAMVYDEQASFADRLAAYRVLTGIAGVQKPEGDEGEKFQINIQVNS